MYQYPFKYWQMYMTQIFFTTGIESTFLYNLFSHYLNYSGRSEKLRDMKNLIQ